MTLVVRAFQTSSVMLTLADRPVSPRSDKFRFFSQILFGRQLPPPSAAAIGLPFTQSQPTVVRPLRCCSESATGWPNEAVAVPFICNPFKLYFFLYIICVTVEDSFLSS